VFGIRCVRRVQLGDQRHLEVMKLAYDIH
jgi:hypothetical protein